MSVENTRKIRRALISVSDKTGIVEFARELEKFGVEIISTGGTARALAGEGIKVREVAEVTGFPEMMDGRVKTLHPKIHGGLLGLRDNENHVAAMRDNDITPIDLLVVNLYPFEETVADENVKLSEAVEQIDIGGPAMIRSAAKNFRDVAVVVEPNFYEIVLEQMQKNDGAVSVNLREMLATIAFARTAAYDAAISNYLMDAIDPNQFEMEWVQAAMTAASNFSLSFDEDDEDFEDEDFEDDDEFDEIIETNGHFDDSKDAELSDFYEEERLELAKIEDLRYGENPHQNAALYEGFYDGGVAQAELLGGKEMSYNNYVDADAAWNLVMDFPDLACAIIKHTNPSGVGVGANASEAYARALATDTVSAFGGIVAFNRTVDAEAAKLLTEIFTEVVLAPDFDADALPILQAKKNLRILRVAPLEEDDKIEFKQISGGFLAQIKDSRRITESDLQIVTKKQPTESEIRALLFAWNVCKHVKSNAIVLANEFQTVGVGAGQMNRLDSVRIAAQRAARTELKMENVVLASDAFFPFRDGVDEAAKTGVTAIIQPGGSVRDAEVIAAADEHGLAMVLTGVRHFKH